MPYSVELYGRYNEGEDYNDLGTLLLKEMIGDGIIAGKLREKER